MSSNSSLATIKNTLYKSDSHGNLSFQVPTRVTKLDPVFNFHFYVDTTNTNKKDIEFDVQLNPKLCYDNSAFRQRYKFDENGICQLNHSAGDDYFIEGEIEYINKENKECFVSITYGNNKEALHFIKGKFRLNNIDVN